MLGAVETDIGPSLFSPSAGCSQWFLLASVLALMLEGIVIASGMKSCRGGMGDQEAGFVGIHAQKPAVCWRALAGGSWQ
jgi:hypothetical protein